MQQKRTDVQKIGNYAYKFYGQNINFHVVSSVSQLGNQEYGSCLHTFLMFLLFDLSHRQPILQSTLLVVVMLSHILSLCQSSTSPMRYEEMA